ncbi:MAG: DUF1902 domain-containing protein [Brevundimonas sp.]|uniref:DUF1902 domain-containing protein n=1 Tax=Brevundimonas sp. TaxID=1871086 RepID=UPI002489A5C4|nr:DUF1902 domain-containing protein [Brevundimonas sp.]MDI1325652.1 DUF1902 domain-containing protein [Brevundimonas sp.]
MRKPPYFVKASWDDQAKVWYSNSNIPGLVIEADTLAEFERLMNELAPEMLSANADVHQVNVPFEFSACQKRELAVA